MARLEGENCWGLVVGPALLDISSNALALQRGLDSLESWAAKNLVLFTKEKCSPRHQDTLGAPSWAERTWEFWWTPG